MAKSSSFHKPRPSNKSCFDEPAQRTKRVEKRTVVTDPGLLNRTSYTNATVAIQHVKKVRGPTDPKIVYFSIN